jgi:hypothetical protein
MTVSARSGPFGDATGEAFPLDVAPGVSLEGEGSGGVSIATAAPVASSMLVLHAGATLRGVTLVNRVGAATASASGSAPTAAVALACDPDPAPPVATLDGVTVDTDALTRGISVTCPAALTNVRVSGARGPALYVNPPDAAFETTVTGGRFGESATGVEVHGGVVRLAGPDGASPDAFLGFAAPTLDITANEQHGVAVGSGTVTSLALERVRIAGNGGTGLRVDDLASGSSLSIVRCEISGNRASVDASQYASPVRKAGGIILSQANGPPALDFRGNLVACNGADQIGFFVVGNVNLAPSACGTDSNVVRTSVTGQVAVFASDYANVSASKNYWIPVPPPYSAKQLTWTQPCALPDNAPSPCP